jgi:hypothetical protein
MDADAASRFPRKRRRSCTMIGVRRQAMPRPHTSRPMSPCLEQRARRPGPHPVARGEHRRVCPGRLVQSIPCSPSAPSSPCELPLLRGGVEPKPGREGVRPAGLKRAARSNVLAFHRPRPFHPFPFLSPFRAPRFGLRHLLACIARFHARYPPATTTIARQQEYTAPVRPTYTCRIGPSLSSRVGVCFLFIKAAS